MNQPRTIVVADDQAPIRNLLKAILETCGYKVLTADDGREALDILRDHAADLLVTDLVMPGQEGLETVVTARRTHPHLKILVVSGYQEYFKTALMLGANEVILKPFDPVKLRQTVMDLLGDA